jgi:hypothetical protein
MMIQQMKAKERLPMVDYIGSLFQGKEETLHWCRGFENTIFSSKGGGGEPIYK